MEEKTDIRLPEPRQPEPLSEAMQAHIRREGWILGTFTPREQQFLQLMEASGMSFARPLGQQLDLLVEWAERCVEAIRKGAE